MKRYLNEITGFIFFLLGILLFFTLLGYSADQIPYQTYPPTGQADNLLSISGLYIAWGLFFLFGKASHLLSFLFICWGISKFLHQQPQRLYIKLFAPLCALISLSILTSLIYAANAAVAIANGGIIGMVLAKSIENLTGIIAGAVIFTILFLLSFMLASEFTLFQIFRICIACIARILFFVRILILRAFNLYDTAEDQTDATAKTPARKPASKPTINMQSRAQKKVSEEDDENEEYEEEYDEEDEEDDEEQERKKPVIKISNKPTLSQLKKKAEEEEAQARKARRIPIATPQGPYELPTIELLDIPPIDNTADETEEDLENSAKVLEDTMRDFGIEVSCVNVDKGPVITRYELQPAPGVKINRISNLADDIALTMKSSNVRVVAPIPGKGLVGVEVPNNKTSPVYLRELLDSSEFKEDKSKLVLALGKDVSGEPVIADLAEMPHLLIAGTTGSGKTVCVNSIINSMLFNCSPAELKFIMVDPKMVELACFNDIPHQLCPVQTNPKKVIHALEWVVEEMERRYKLLAKAGARNIARFNKKISSGEIDFDIEEEGEDQPLPYIVVIIDELADLMMIAPKEIEGCITRLAQLSRAVGIHMILATQRPSVDVITGVIKANFPARISFKVASKVDSRTVLDINGADKLIGKGDMLFLQPAKAKPIRAQGCYVKDDEINRIVDFIKAQQSPIFIEDLANPTSQNKKTRSLEKDDLYEEAKKLVIDTRQASTSMLQRRLGVGYTRAARIMDILEDEGIVGPYKGNKPREILVSGYEEIDEDDELKDRGYEQDTDDDDYEYEYEDGDGDDDEDDDEYEKQDDYEDDEDE